MSSVHQDVLELPLEQRALLAFKAAVRKAIAERNREGLPVFVWSGSGVTDLSMRARQARSDRLTKRTARGRKRAERG